MRTSGDLPAWLRAELEQTRDRYLYELIHCPREECVTHERDWAVVKTACGLLGEQLPRRPQAWWEE